MLASLEACLASWAAWRASRLGSSGQGRAAKAPTRLLLWQGRCMHIAAGLWFGVQGLGLSSPITSRPGRQDRSTTKVMLRSSSLASLGHFLQHQQNGVELKRRVDAYQKLCQAG